MGTGARPTPGTFAGLTHCVAVQQKDTMGQTAILHPQVERVGAVEVDVGLEQSTVRCWAGSTGDPDTAPTPHHQPKAPSRLGGKPWACRPRHHPRQQSSALSKSLGSPGGEQLLSRAPGDTEPDLGTTVPRACQGLKPGPRAQLAHTTFPSPKQDIRGSGAVLAVRTSISLSLSPTPYHRCHVPIPEGDPGPRHVEDQRRQVFPQPRNETGGQGGGDLQELVCEEEGCDGGVQPARQKGRLQQTAPTVPSSRGGRGTRSRATSPAGTHGYLSPCETKPGFSQAPGSNSPSQPPNCRGAEAKPLQALTATLLRSPVSPAAPGSPPARQRGRCQVPQTGSLLRALTGRGRRAAGKRRCRRGPG